MSEHLNCKEVSRLLSDGLDKDIPAAERARLRLHLAICQACRNVDQQLALLRRAMRRMSRPDDEGRDGGGP